VAAREVIIRDYSGPVIKVGDTCYEAAGLVWDPVTAVPEELYETCEECLNPSSSGTDQSSESSRSSGSRQSGRSSSSDQSSESSRSSGSIQPGSSSSSEDNAQ